MWHDLNGVAWLKASRQNHLTTMQQWFMVLTITPSHMAPTSLATVLSTATMEVHVTSAMSCWYHVRKNTLIFPNFKIFTRAAMEPKIKLVDGQFKPGAYWLDLCTQTLTLLYRIFNQFRCRNWGFYLISPQLCMATLSFLEFSQLQAQNMHI